MRTQEHSFARQRNRNELRRRARSTTAGDTHACVLLRPTFLLRPELNVVLGRRTHMSCVLLGPIFLLRPALNEVLGHHTHASCLDQHSCFERNGTTSWADTHTHMRPVFTNIPVSTGTQRGLGQTHTQAYCSDQHSCFDRHETVLGRRTHTSCLDQHSCFGWYATRFWGYAQPMCDLHIAQ